MTVSPKMVGKVATLSDFAASGVLTGIGNIELYRLIVIAQATASIALTLPNPSDTSIDFVVTIANDGTASLVVGASSIPPGSACAYAWSGSAWAPVGPGMIGAASGADGAPGLVPAPVAGQQGAYFRGDGTWSREVPAAWTFTAMPQVHVLGNNTTPIFARTATDNITVGAWNANHDGTAGDVLHFTTGVNTAPSRVVADLVTTSGSAVVTSATASFVNADGSNGNGGDLLKLITAAGIPAGTTILSVQSATRATLSAQATVSASGVSATIGAGNVDGCVIAIGVDNGANGLVVRNKYKGNGVNLQQTNTVASATSYALVVTNASAVAPAVRMQQSGAADLMQLYASSAPANSNLLTVYDNAGLSGSIRADTGTIVWNRDVKTIASNTGQSPQIAAKDSYGSSAYLSCYTYGFTGLKVYEYSGSAGLFYASDIYATSTNTSLRVATGAAAIGSETMANMVTVQNGGKLGFFNKTPALQQTAPAALLTDGTPTNTTICTAVNALRTALVNLGLAA